MRVAVIGCGIGGMAATLFLVRAGARVALFERFAVPKPVGAGLLLQPTGLAILARLGLRTEATALGARIDRLSGMTTARHRVLDLDYGDLHPGLHGLGIARGTLFSLLLRRVEQSGAEMLTGRDVVALDRQDDDRDIKIRDASDTVHGPFDLVVVASGANTELRLRATNADHARAYDWGALWTTCEDPDNRLAGTLHQRYDGPQRMCGLMPIGRPAGESPGVPQVAFFWSLRVEAYEQWRADGIEAWRAEVAAMWPEAEPFARQIAAPEVLALATYKDVRMGLRRVGRAVFIGDAAHGTSPQLGQGANLALMDAASLGDALLSGGDISGAIDRFIDQRRAHVRFYQRASRWLTPFFQSSHSPLGHARDLACGPMCRFGVTRRHMLETLAGIKTGAFSRLPEGHWLAAAPCESS